MNALEISVDDGLMLLCSSLTWSILVACDLLCLQQHVQSRSNLSWHLCLSSLVVAGLHCRCKQFLWFLLCTWSDLFVANFLERLYALTKAILINWVHLQPCKWIVGDARRSAHRRYCFRGWGVWHMILGWRTNRAIWIPRVRPWEPSLWKLQMSRPIIARGLLGLCILHGCPTMAVTIRGEDHLLVLLKKRFFSFKFVTQRWVLLRTLERILCFEVTVQSVVKVLHVCHHV